MSQARIAQLIELTRQHDPDLAAWLRDALDEWRGGVDLAAALELSGGRAIARRNAALLEAARLLSDGVAGPWAVAGLLADAVKRFEQRVLPRLQSRSEKTLSAVDAHLAKAFAATPTGRMLRSKGKLYALLK